MTTPFEPERCYKLDLWRALESSGVPPEVAEYADLLNSDKGFAIFTVRATTEGDYYHELHSWLVSLGIPPGEKVVLTCFVP